MLITGKEDTDHLATLEKVCEFMKQSVRYLRHVVDAQGLHTSPDKFKTIKEAPRPTNQQQLRAFLA